MSKRPFIIPQAMLPETRRSFVDELHAGAPRPSGAAAGIGAAAIAATVPVAAGAYVTTARFGAVLPTMLPGRQGKGQMSDREVDQQLVERAQRGEKKAFELLVLKYQRKLERLLSRVIR